MSHNTHLPVSNMTGIVDPPSVILLTYTEFAKFFILIASLFSNLDDGDTVSYFDGPCQTSKGKETAWTECTRQRTSRRLIRRMKVAV